MKPLTAHSLILICLSALTPLSASINFSVNWDFDGSTEVDLSSTASLDLSGLNMVFSPAVVSGDWHSSVMGSYWAPSFDAYNPGDYFEFSLSADAGSTIEIASLSFRQTGAGTGTAHTWELRSSVDGYLSTLATDTVGSTPSGSFESATSLGLTSVGNSVTLRIFGFGGGPDQFAGFAISDVSVTGTAVPEPSHYGLIGGLFAVAMLFSRRGLQGLERA